MAVRRSVTSTQKGFRHMGNETPSLKKLIDNSLAELTRAQDIAERTARPQNVCAGHDALFALTRAVASGVATSLSVSAGRLSEADAMPPMVDGAGQVMGGWALAWKFVNANARTILAWVGIWGIVIILKGELKTCLDVIPKADTQSASAYGKYQEAPYP